MLIEFKYKDEEPLRFNNPSSALAYFTNKGWGMWNFQIKVDGEPKTLDEYNDIADQVGAYN